MRDTAPDEIHAVTRKPLFIPLDDVMGRPAEMTTCRCKSDCECSAGSVIGSTSPVRRDRLATEIAKTSKDLSGAQNVEPLPVLWFGVLCDTWCDPKGTFPRYRNFRPIRTLDMEGPLPVLQYRRVPTGE